MDAAPSTGERAAVDSDDLAIWKDLAHGKLHVLNVVSTEGANVSDQEPTQTDDQHTDEQMQDLDVAEEQQDDVTGGGRIRGGGPGEKGIMGDSAAQK